MAYPGLPDPYADQLASKDSGIFRLDLETGKQELIISVAEIAGLGKIPGNSKEVKHYFNHLLFNTDGSRFVFLHRWAPSICRRSTKANGGAIRTHVSARKAEALSLTRRTAATADRCTSST